jgi:hypothetical protein
MTPAAFARARGGQRQRRAGRRETHRHTDTQTHREGGAPMKRLSRKKLNVKRKRM